MEDSILVSIKALLGPDSDYDVFDQDILIFINSALATLHQLGVGPKEGFQITGADEKWSDFINDDPCLNSVKTYVFMKVKMAFDPPSNSFVMAAYEKACEEFEWRLNVVVDPSQN